MSVRDIDKGWKNFVKQAEFWVKNEVVIGWVEGKKEARKDEAITNAELASVHEFGTKDGRIPEGRLGLREWVDRSQSEIGKRIAEGYKAAVPHGDAKKELNRIGLWATADWKKYLKTVQPGPEWSDATEKMKVKKLGNKRFLNEKKLIVTGQLMNGITHVVRRKSA